MRSKGKLEYKEEENNMFCTSCGKQISKGANFCGQCGTPVPKEPRCPNCQAALPDDAFFCVQCGTKVADAPHTVPVNNHPTQPQQTACVQPEYENPSSVDYTPTGSQLQKHSMISKYNGKPTVGIAKATGTLIVYDDHLEYTKTMGNALGNAFGLAGMAVAAKNAKKDGKVEIYLYGDIQNASVGTYAGMMPTLVLEMNDDQVFTFTGTFTKQSVTSIVNAILKFNDNL